MAKKGGWKKKCNWECESERLKPNKMSTCKWFIRWCCDKMMLWQFSHLSSLRSHPLQTCFISDQRKLLKNKIIQDWKCHMKLMYLRQLSHLLLLINSDSHNIYFVQEGELLIVTDHCTCSSNVYNFQLIYQHILFCYINNLVFKLPLDLIMSSKRNQKVNVEKKETRQKWRTAFDTRQHKSRWPEILL